MVELEATGKATNQDVVSGAERPSAENPFRELGKTDGTRQKPERTRIRLRWWVAGLIGLTAGVTGIVWLVKWIDQWGRAANAWN